jgi:hypothetical protein
VSTSENQANGSTALRLHVATKLSNTIAGHLNRRGGDGTISQALSLMNSQFVDSHLQTEGPAANQLIVKNLDMSNPDLVKTLFLNILSRYPSSDELDKATAALPAASGSARTQAVQDLVWSLYNKVDFVFNY